MGSTTFSGPVTSTGGFVGEVTGDTIAVVETAEHGAGSIGTSGFGAPQTYRWIDKGVIITQIKFDITGLGVKGTAENDVIGLVAGGVAFIGRYVVATNGVLFKSELTCIEAPGEGTSTITQDIDLVVNSSAVLIYDGAASTKKLHNTGTLVVNETVVNLLPGAGGTAISANDYIYIVEGDTAATTGVYDAGMFILTMYGHAVLA